MLPGRRWALRPAGAVSARDTSPGRRSPDGGAAGVARDGRVGGRSLPGRVASLPKSRSRRSGSACRSSRQPRRRCWATGSSSVGSRPRRCWRVWRRCGTPGSRSGAARPSRVRLGGSRGSDSDADRTGGDLAGRGGGRIDRRGRPRTGAAPPGPGHSAASAALPDALPRVLGSVALCQHRPVS